MTTQDHVNAALKIAQAEAFGLISFKARLNRQMVRCMFPPVQDEASKGWIRYIPEQEVENWKRTKNVLYTRIIKAETINLIQKSKYATL